jgi:hypothetical protein
VFSLPYSEAQKIAIVLEETWAYEYKENRKNKDGGSGTSTGLQQGFEEDFTFGDDDDNDYMDKEGLIEFWRKEELRRNAQES